MSTPDYPNKPPVADFVQPYRSQPLPPPKENGLGIAGFITSIVGIVTCGTLSIVGVVLSAIGLRKEPKGMAIAGLIIGLIGLVELIAVIAFSITVARATQQMANTFQSIATTGQLTQKANRIGDEWESNEKLPTQAEGDALVATDTDLWGNPIQYETDGASFSLRSSGTDGVLDTEDDIIVGPYADATAAQSDTYSDFEADFEGDWEEEWGDKLGEDLNGLEMDDVEIDAADSDSVNKTEDRNLELIPANDKGGN